MDLREHFDWVAANNTRARHAQRDFHAQLLALYRHHISEGMRVLEVGCGQGDLLAALRPSHGLGLDFSPRMLSDARSRHGAVPGLEFREADAEHLRLDESFDHIVLDYLTGYVGDIQVLLQSLQAAAHDRTRLHLTTLNNLWRWPLRWAEGLGVVMPQPPSNWLSHHDLFNLLELAGWEVVTFERVQLFPYEWPLVSDFLNSVLVRLPGFRHLGITLWVTARPRRPVQPTGDVSCSVIVPARNEAGNIRPALERIPVLGRRTDPILGYSKMHRGVDFAAATGDVLVIQDADLTAPPEDLPKFYDALTGGAAEFVNGSRLVYPMEKRAMRFLNFLGNKFFALALSFVLSQPVKDSLCGTKMLLRSDYERLLRRIAVLGDFDPFGDFNLLFGSALLDLKIRDLPVRYKDRTYGETNISRFTHGWILLRMTAFALWRVKFRFGPRA